MLACSRNGYVVNPSLHRAYAAAEIVELVGRHPRLGAGRRSGLRRAAATFSRWRARCRRCAASIGWRRADGERRRQRAPRPFPRPTAIAAPPPPDHNPDKIVYLAFTSGTTGKPKGVLHSDNTLLANGRAMVADWKPRRAHGAAEPSPLDPPHRHGRGRADARRRAASSSSTIRRRARACSTGCSRPAPPTSWACRRTPWTCSTRCAERGLERLGAVRIFYMAGAPIPRETAQAFLDRGITPQNIYGMTENGSHQYTLPDDDARTIVATCGRAGQRLRGPHLQGRRSRHRGRARRGRRDRRPRRRSALGLFRRPVRDRSVVQPLTAGS